MFLLQIGDALKFMERIKIWAMEELDATEMWEVVEDSSTKSDASTE